MNSQRSPITWQKLTRKSIVWSLWLFAAALVQTSVLSRYQPFGVVPEIVLPCVIAIAIHDGERSATICGITGGLIIDSLGSGGFSASAVVYMLLAVAAAFLTYSVLSRDFLSWAIATVFALAVCNVVSSIYAGISVGAPFFEYLGRTFFRYIFSSFIFSLPFYVVTRLIWRRFFNNREMEG
ncbi:MAG: rod shape-determining protein MreD [Clostridia bacterium]|nr:rod shape-determining protein MreD [Clostridia bacterium]